MSQNGGSVPPKVSRDTDETEGLALAKRKIRKAEVGPGVSGKSGHLKKRRGTVTDRDEEWERPPLAQPGKRKNWARDFAKKEVQKRRWINEKSARIFVIRGPARREKRRPPVMRRSYPREMTGKRCCVPRPNSRPIPASCGGVQAETRRDYTRHGRDFFRHGQAGVLSSHDCSPIH